MITNNDMEMREKYPKAADLLDSAVQIIYKAYNLKPTEPAHDVAEWMLTQFFVESGD